jgi:cation transport ATPase
MRIRLVYRPSYRRARLAELRAGYPRRRPATSVAPDFMPRAEAPVCPPPNFALPTEAAPEPAAEADFLFSTASDAEPQDAAEFAPSRALKLMRLWVLLLMRMATVGVAMAVWCIASEIGFTVHFVFDKGLLQHWQIWFAAALFLYAGSAVLARQLQSAARRARIAMTQAPRAA